MSDKDRAKKDHLSDFVPFVAETVVS